MMPNYSQITNEELLQIHDSLAQQNDKVKAWQIKEAIKTQKGIDLDESTIRGRFIEMGYPLSAHAPHEGATVKKKEQESKEPDTQRQDISKVSAYAQTVIPEILKPHIPNANDFIGYIERPIDTKLAVHYNLGVSTGRYKYPLTQGKQGTGKTMSHRFYAWKMGLPFFLYSCYEDFKLRKLFGDKSIKNSNIIFQESLFVKAIQGPSVVLFDEINAVSNAQTFDWHALLQNRELFIKDADDGQGKVYLLHKECRIGFAQNPKSAKYIGGVIKPSNFLGRCTHITYPEFTKQEIKDAIKKVFPNLQSKDLNSFVQYYFAIVETIEKANIPVDISIRQLINVIDLWMHGLDLKSALEDGLINILDAISQPKAKESFVRIAQAIWKELMEV